MKKSARPIVCRHGSHKTWHALLAALATLLITGTTVQPAPGENDMKMLFDFQSADEEKRWITVNDGVMGGVSSSSFTVIEDSTAEFSGEVSLENYGGFASARTRPHDFGLGEFDGVRIRVKGDGNRYQFRLRTGKEFDGIAFRMDFETETDTWLEIDLPFDRFVATFRGRVLKDIGAPEPGKIRQIGFLIADKQAGDFSLKIDWIKAY